MILALSITTYQYSISISIKCQYQYINTVYMFYVLCIRYVISINQYQALDLVIRLLPAS